MLSLAEALAGQPQVIRWEEPPPGNARRPLGSGHSRYTAVADELRAQPGRWALVFEGRAGMATGLATHIRMGSMHCFTPAGDFDAVSRRIDGYTRVYARYVGDEEAGHV